ncbi:unnamed protein product [Caenorhabditis angaria]|uniref:G-protein coupled receptors family 1 profile domain-containing protein n=1 Tax=Caenorhabditis angaria TaxID=860376 RepID=A0A9P1N8W6_9PELO|nr:unnamed protein product [Caenorhabditis angaria]
MSNENVTFWEALDENCTVYSQFYPDPSLSPYATIPFAIVYVCIFILGLVGNATVIFVTCNNEALLTVQNIFILNLAASDIMMCILSVPITPITNVAKNWYFGNMLCHLIPCIQGISTFVCTFSLTAIAIDRYILVVKPHRTPLSQRGALMTTIFIWIISCVVTVPYAFNMQMVEYKEDRICGFFCTERWETARQRRIYTFIVMLSQFVLPFAIMAFCYYNIFAVLNRRTQSKIRRMDERSLALENSCAFPSHGLANYENEMNTFLDKQEREKTKMLHQNRRTTSILLTMVIWFGGTWLPHNIVSLIIEYDDTHQFFQISNREDWDISYLLNLFTHCIAMSNLVVNPVLYAWLNPTFRQLVIKQFFGAKKKSERAIFEKKAKVVPPPRKRSIKKDIVIEHSEFDTYL